MKTTLFLFLAGVAVSVESRGCVPGSTIIGVGNCTACVCKEEDTQFHCEDKSYCPLRTEIMDSTGYRCIPGIKLVTKDKCKKCICKEDKRFDCSKDDKCGNKTTKQEEKKKAEIEGEKKVEKCTPEELWVFDGECQKCMCSNDYKKVSDSCLKQDEECTKFRSAKNEPCAADDEFVTKDGCNNCTCTKEGWAMCTNKICEIKS